MKEKSVKQRGSEAVKKFFLMLIFRRRKGDSETDSTDLIMCGPTQAWEKKRRKSMSNKWLQDKKNFLFVQLTMKDLLS